MKTRKILSAFLVCVMIVCAMSVTAFAKETTVANLDDLKTALANAKNDDVIKLSADITATEAIKATDVTIDLCGKTLHLANNANNYFCGTTTIKNGTISVNNVRVASDCIIGIGDRSNDATVNFKDVNITGSDYNSAFAVLLVYGDNTLNIENGVWNLSNEQSLAGGVIKSEDGASNLANVNITGTKMTFKNISRGISGSTAVLDDVEMTITGGDNGINGAELTVKNSTLNISGGTGRALTVTNHDVFIESSTLNFSNNKEADIRFKTANTLSIDDTSTLSKCTVFANAEGAKINGAEVTGTKEKPSAVTVKNGETTIIPTDAVASVGNAMYFSLADAVNAAKDGDTIEILAAGTYSVPTGKNVTITGKVDGVVFECGNNNIGMNGASVTFNNVTFNWAANGWPYHGLAHCGNMIYNNCTFNGTVFLYGTSEIFNECVFNVTGDTYNVWTYSANKVEFNNCTFNCAGKSVLVYHEGATQFTDLTVTDCDFVATQTVKGKAAIEIDTSLTAGAKITVDAATTVNDKFGTGSVSENSLWNNKKGSEGANNDITVVVNETTVLKPVVPITGSSSYAYTKEVDGYVRVWGEGGGNASESFVLKLYSGEDLMATTQLNNVGGIIDGDVYVTWNFFYPESNDEYWTTTWEEGHPNCMAQPTKVVLYIDGVAVATTDAKMSGADDVNPVVWAELGGVAKCVAQIGDTKYTSLQAALNAAVATKNGNVTVEILDDIDLTGKNWTPVYFDSYSAANANTIVIEGNNKIITGLSDMMFSGVWKGDKLEIRNLTLDKANIVNDAADTENKGVGAFVGKVNAVKELVITNCKLTNSHVKGGHWTGGFVGYAAGYSGNDGPEFTEITVEGCSVENSKITGKGSVGGIVGHATGDAWTSFDVKTTNITKNTITSTGSSKNKAGIVMGTIGAAGTAQTTNGTTLTGGVKVAVTENGNTATSNGTAITTVYGRQGNATSVLTITGGTYANNPIEENVSYAAPAEGFEIVKNENGTFGVVEKVEETMDTKVGIITYPTTNAKGNIEVSLVAGIDSLKYSKVGFEVTVNGVTEKIPYNAVYDSIKVKINGEDKILYSSDFGDNVKFVYGITIEFPASLDGNVIEYRPYAIKLDGVTTIYGEASSRSDIYDGVIASEEE